MSGNMTTLPSNWASKVASLRNCKDRKFAPADDVPLEIFISSDCQYRNVMYQPSLLLVDIYAEAVGSPQNAQGAYGVCFAPGSELNFSDLIEEWSGGGQEIANAMAACRLLGSLPLESMCCSVIHKVVIRTANWGLYTMGKFVSEEEATGLVPKSRRSLEHLSKFIELNEMCLQYEALDIKILFWKVSESEVAFAKELVWDELSKLGFDEGEIDEVNEATELASKVHNENAVVEELARLRM